MATEGQQVEVKLPGSEKFIEKYCVAFENIKAGKTAEGEIKTQVFLENLENLAENLYKIMLGDGLITNQLIHDIQNSLHTVRINFDAHKEEYATLENMISVEVKRRGTKECFKDKKSAAIGLLWSYRSLNFHCTFIEHMLLPEKLSPKEACKQTYSKVLAMYHGWIVSGTFKQALGFICPTEEKIIKAFGFDTREALKPLLERFVAAARPVLNQIIAHLEKCGVNFPDKV